MSLFVCLQTEEWCRAVQHFQSSCAEPGKQWSRVCLCLTQQESREGCRVDVPEGAQQHSHGWKRTWSPTCHGHCLFPSEPNQGAEGQGCGKEGRVAGAGEGALLIPRVMVLCGEMWEALIPQGVYYSSSCGSRVWG